MAKRGNFSDTYFMKASLSVLETVIYRYTSSRKKRPNSATFGCERAKNLPNMYKASGKLEIDVVSSYITIFSFLGAEIILTSPAEMQNALFIITFFFQEKLDSFYRLPDPVIRNLWFSIFYFCSLFFQNASWLETVKTGGEASP